VASAQFLPITFAIGGFLVLVGGLLILVLGLRMGGVSVEAQRLHRVVGETLEAGESQLDPLAFRQAELQGSFRQRTLLPWFRALGGLIGRMTPARSLESLGRQMAIAGHPLGLGPREFYGLQLLFIVLSFWLVFSQLRSALAPPETPVAVNSLAAATQTEQAPALNLTSLLVAMLGLYIGTQGPKMWLRGRVRARQRRIRLNLPDALDMLSVCADAGLGFDQSLQRISERWKTPLSLELNRVVHEQSMGRSRSEAMRSLADRLDVPELTSFVAVIIQSDQMGMSITDTLRSQAEQMRVERRHRAQEEARKAPLKMLFPMLILIMPAMGAVVVGPVVPSMLDMFSGIMAR
jgi:tight adherence protein C